MGSRIGFVYEHSSASRTVLVEGDAVNYLSEKLVYPSIDQIEVSFERWLLE